MKRQQSWISSVLHSMQMEGETLPLQPVLELCGDRRVLIENHYGVTEYSLERICVQVRFGKIVISGSDLHLRRMQGHVLVITGRIDHICLNRRTK